MKSSSSPNSSMPLGIYISVPFCRSKCSFCNFASGVFSREKMGRYVQRVQDDIQQAERLAGSLGAVFDTKVDSIYLGGGTPTTLDPDLLSALLVSLRSQFELSAGTEITVECAPGTLSPEMLQVLIEVGTNRISLGTQSFVDQEIRSVGRLHSAQQTLADIAALRQSGIHNISVDLIAGLPHQTQESWRASLEQLAKAAVPHASVYMLEVDADSRLGRELIAGGERYHAHHVPDLDLTADMYLEAVEFLSGAGLPQYEISNFARPGSESLHNLKHWRRQPYLGFGLDAHSMLYGADGSDFESVRFGTTDDLNAYIEGDSLEITKVHPQEAIEESFFLGLRLNTGVNLAAMSPQAVATFESEIDDLIADGLLEQSAEHIRLTARGRLLSNEVFERFITAEQAV